MSANIVEKKVSPFPPGYRYIWNRFCACLNFNSVLIETGQGRKLTLLEYLRQTRSVYQDHEEKAEEEWKDIVVYPSTIEPNKKNGTLFVVSHHDIKFPVRSFNIANINDFIHQTGCWDERELVRQLRDNSVKWFVQRPSSDPNDIYLTVLGKRDFSLREDGVYMPFHSEEGEKWPLPRMIGFGIYNILPADVVQEAESNSWRIEVLNPGQDSHRRHETVQESETYPDPHCASTLMNIPVVFRDISLHSANIVKRKYVDMRKLRNIELIQIIGLFDHGSNNVCQDTSQLFDAMIMSGFLWSVKEDKIYLPCLRRSPQLFSTATDKSDEKYVYEEDICELFNQHLQTRYT